jgi:hypothetical protein
VEHKTGTLIGEYNYEDYEIKRKVLEIILKKIKNGKSSGKDNIPSELYKYGSDKFKIILLKILNEIYVTGTTAAAAAEWNNAIVIPTIKKKTGKIQTEE